MTDLLDLVYEYRRLLARRDRDGSLPAMQGRRLAGLERLFGSEPGGTRPGHPRRRHARCEVMLPATIRADDHVQAVDIVDLGGGGIRVEPAPLLDPGQRAEVRIVCQETGRVYVYPVEAKWCRRSARESTMGMPFIGAPRSSRLAA